MKKKINKYINKGEITELLIGNENKIEAVVLIDTNKVNELKQYSFRLSNGYVKTTINKKTMYLHRIVYGNISDGKEVDHINRNKLDNRLCNLRVVTHKENCFNRGYEETSGIVKLKRLKSKPYHLRINQKHYGYFESIEKALEKKREVLRELDMGI